MASVHKLKGKANWICFYTDRSGRRRCKSSLTTDRREAQRVCSEVQKIEDRARTGRLTSDKARQVIESTVSDIMESLGSPIQRKTIGQHFESWKNTFKSEVKPGTYIRYAGIADCFLTWLKAKAGADLATLQPEMIEQYRDHMAVRVAAGTVNVHLKVLRVALEKAVKQKVFNSNPARLVDNLDGSGRHERRAFTLPELRKIITAAGDEWKTAIFIGIYTGLRLSDVANLTWSNLDLSRKEITVKTRKTGRVQIIPIAGPLLAHIETLPAGDDPKAPLCPRLAGQSTGWLSGQFRELLASVGLVEAQGSHLKRKSGRDMRRTLSDVSFHALRHTATSLLKNAGVNAAVVMDIIGHESEAMSQNYTHIDDATKRAAIAKMPDVMKG